MFTRHKQCKEIQNVYSFLRCLNNIDKLLLNMHTTNFLIVENTKTPNDQWLLI